MAALINLAHLDEQTFGDLAIRREVIDLFQAQAPVIMAAISASTGQARSDAAHRLRGSALALGAGPLAEASFRLEAAPDDTTALAGVVNLLDATVVALTLLDQAS
jgi:HPt (histidine-containing phosphotransfer) domain-containing protein